MVKEESYVYDQSALIEPEPLPDHFTAMTFDGRQMQETLEEAEPVVATQMMKTVDDRVPPNQ